MHLAIDTETASDNGALPDPATNDNTDPVHHIAPPINPSVCCHQHWLKYSPSATGSPATGQYANQGSMQPVETKVPNVKKNQNS